jgi:hypothetical protein
MSEHEDAVRRALDEVAARTAAADREPPPLDERVVALSSWRPSRAQRVVLGAVAAVIAVVAGVLVAALAGDDDDPDTIETADETTSTTRDDTSTSTSTTGTTVTTVTSTTATTEVPATPTTMRSDDWVEIAGDLEGSGWRVFRSADEGCLFVVLGAGHLAEEICDLEAPAGPLGGIHAVEVAQPDGSSRVLLVAVAGSGLDEVELFPGAGVNGRTLLGLVDDPAGDGRFLVTDQVWAFDALLLRDGDDLIGGVYGLELMTEEPFGRVPGYRFATESLSLGLLQVIGHYPYEGGHCVLARQVLPEPALVADACFDDPGPQAVAVPTSMAEFADLFGIVPEASAGDWSCEFPDGESCGGGLGPVVAGSGVAVLGGSGPILTTDAQGNRAERVTVVLADGTRFEVAIPPA